MKPFTAEQFKSKKSELERGLKLNRRRIFKKAHYLFKTGNYTWSEALKQSWAERKSYQLSESFADDKREIARIKDLLLSWNTPKHYTQTSEYTTRSMESAYRMGINLNA